MRQVRAGRGALGSRVGQHVGVGKAVDDQSESRGVVSVSVSGRDSSDNDARLLGRRRRSGREWLGRGVVRVREGGLWRSTATQSRGQPLSSPSQPASQPAASLYQQLGGFAAARARSRGARLFACPCLCLSLLLLLRISMSYSC